MIHVQGQAGANWRRHADFTALAEPILLKDPLTLSSLLLSAVSAPAPDSASSLRLRSPEPVHPCVALPFIFP